MPTINLAAYFATIQKKTGLTANDFKPLAAEKSWMEGDRLKEGLTILAG